MAKHTLESVAISSPSNDISVAIAASDHDLTDHEPAELDKSMPCHMDKQKLDFALNKMTEKTPISAAQKAKALVQIYYIAAKINGIHMDTRNYIKAKRSKIEFKR
uniref:Uncharacterized protein n=1 Tax=Romanomermis culicivorax TaxID=13658 RepID=A0A915L0T2_ROMCU